MSFDKRQKMSLPSEKVSTRRLRFAVLCDSDALELWQSAAIRELLSDGYSDLVAVLTARQQATGSRGGGLFQAVVAPSQRDIADFADDIIRSGASELPRLCVNGEEQFGANVDSALRDELSALRLDFILYVGFGQCDSRIATHAVYGLWRFRFGDISKFFNYPPGIWEILAGDPVSSAMLCRQYPGGRSAVVLRSGAYATILHQPNANANQMLEDVSHWPAYVARNICKGLSEGTGESMDLPPVADPRWPGVGIRARLALSILKHKVARFPNLFFDDTWNVGLVNEPIHGFLKPDPSRHASWFPNRDRRVYFADPMGATIGDKRVVLCESYDFETQLGSISALDIDERGWIPAVVPVLRLQVHASYPYLFTVGDDLYCIPETSQARQATLYKLTDIRDRPSVMKKLLVDQACLDPTLFRHEGRWWLFCTDAVDGEHTKLHIWHAADLFGEFIPHPLNPVKIDVRSARPAGTPFTHEERLFRPSQDCSRTYGGAVTINEIMELSPTTFRERPVASVKPLMRSGYAHGIHTLSSFGEMTLIDSKRRLFTGRGLREKIASTLGRVVRRS